MNVNVKTSLLAFSLTAFSVSTMATASHAFEWRIPGEVAEVGIGAATVATVVESVCHKDKSRSCTEEVKKAAKNTGDYMIGKRNLAKSAEKTFKKVFGL